MSEPSNVPNPGSDEAIDQGCTCPVIDNGHGRGRGDGNFVMDFHCPLHGIAGRSPDEIHAQLVRRSSLRSSVGDGQESDKDRDPT